MNKNNTQLLFQAARVFLFVYQVNFSIFYGLLGKGNKRISFLFFLESLFFFENFGSHLPIFFFGEARENHKKTKEIFLHVHPSKRERQRETDRVTERDRQRQTETDRETERDRQRQTETDRDKQRQRDRQRQTETNRDKQRQRDRQRQTETDRDRETETDRETKRRTGRDRERQRETDRETERQKELPNFLLATKKKVKNRIHSSLTAPEKQISCSLSLSLLLSLFAYVFGIECLIETKHYKKKTLLQRERKIPRGNEK